MIEFRIGLLVGSQSGNAHLVAEAVMDRAREWGMAARILNAAGDAVTDYSNIDGVLICTSSHGSGELPDNLTASWQWLSSNRPDLSHLGYAVIALGDTTYSATYCAAGDTMDRLFEALGARRVQGRLRIDASIQPFADDEAIGWLEQWVPGVRRQLEDIRCSRN
ncbi:flavodoxin domain-containing protein [Sphingopyxis sp.]|uniref:flavodoxin domain-containing protein n=1 Tax=Sphingopyxis sp. TaxID=1908224 RepID=UPI003D6CDB31